MMLDFPPPKPPSIEIDPIDCRTLLIEVLRRACFDWILYRSSTRIEHQLLAQHAYRWMFEEEPGDRFWRERIREGKLLTSFSMICEAIGIPVERMRVAIRKMKTSDVHRVDRFHLERAPGSDDP